MRAPRWSALLLLLVSAVFTATGVFMIRDGHSRGQLVAGCFGLGVLLALALLFMPERRSLLLTVKGFTIHSLFRNYFIDWADVAEFGVSSVGHRRMVCFNYAPGYNRSAIIRRLSVGFAGFEGGLPSSYGLKVMQLAALMSAYRAAALILRYGSTI
ncbi:MAG TPA: hypothetical protein VK433_10410 [Stellaceae bacterium]|nr:hypothetical protein [Stellaceae bacterium]